MQDVNLELLVGDNHDLIVDLACRYARSRDSLDPSWRLVFDRMGGGVAEIVAEARRSGRFSEYFDGSAQRVDGAALDAARLKLEGLLRTFRSSGHRSADLDPLAATRVELAPNLTLARHDLAPGETLAATGTGLGGSAAEIHARLVLAYCGSIGLEADHVLQEEQRLWLYDAFEGSGFALSSRQRTDVLADLVRAACLEGFLQKRHPSVKRFGVEGADALIPLANIILAAAAGSGVDRAVIGGMHRGRLNVLAHVAGKPLSRIFSAFLDLPQAEEIGGYQHDVPYHVGHDGTRTFGGDSIHISLLPHPSHLLAVSAVALGRSKAEQEERSNGPSRVLPLMMHTDAAFAGQGLSSEILQLSGLEGFSVHGAIHIVVNNRIGFTTSEGEGRRTPYCTDIAKAYGIPVLHVNGSDPDAVARCGLIALAFRQRFGADIVIDLNCYRRRGHNELDEPQFTQPLEYRRIAMLPAIHDAYAETLRAAGVDLGEVESLPAAYEAEISQAHAEAQAEDIDPIEWLQGQWANFRASDESVEGPWAQETGVALDRLLALGSATARCPEGRDLHKGFVKFQQGRAETLMPAGRINWATAEALAFASLMAEGYHVRLTGQDVVRGTFTQRHLRWTDQTTGETGNIFDQLEGVPGRLAALNSPLTEYGVLGFEYGYSLSAPKTLSIWEAQFGDFENVAQPIIDQFIVCGEQKWNRLSGLVLSLPHGLEGGGPDHSTGRPERFLSACAAGNITVANCTTPANYFHILRRQMCWPYRKPLVIFSPKAHLRSAIAKSSLSDLVEGTQFRPVIVDEARTRIKPKRLIFCSGRIYYDLVEQSSLEERSAKLIVRIEQLYPFPAQQILGLVRDNPDADCVWLQEEPRNLGPWSYILDRFMECFREIGDRRTLAYIGRPAAAAPSGGSKRVYLAEQAVICRRAVAEDAGSSRVRPAAMSRAI